MTNQHQSNFSNNAFSVKTNKHEHLQSIRLHAKFKQWYLLKLTVRNLNTPDISSNNFQNQRLDVIVCDTFYVTITNLNSIK